MPVTLVALDAVSTVYSFVCAKSSHLVLSRMLQARQLRLGKFVEDKSEMAKGTVKWFNAEKGFGFIQPEDGGNDVFVHITALQEAGIQALQDNQPIEYEMVEGRDERQSAGELKV